MTYKATQVYVVMRDMADDKHPVAIFTDLETAEGNAEGYNLQMKDDGIEGLTFYVTTTILYE